MRTRHTNGALVASAALALFSSVALGCGDGDSVPLQQQQEQQQQTAGTPATTFAAPLPSSGGATGNATATADDGSDQGASGLAPNQLTETQPDLPPPPPNVTPDEVILAPHDPNNPGN